MWLSPLKNGCTRNSKTGELQLSAKVSLNTVIQGRENMVGFQFARDVSKNWQKCP